MQAGDIHPNPGPKRFTLLFANVTSWKNHREKITPLQSDALCLAEVALTAAQQMEQTKSLARSRVWKPIWGTAPPGLKLGGVRSIHHTERGGLAVLTKLGIPSFRDTSLFSEAQSRVMHTRIALGSGKLFLHVIVVYAESGNCSRAKAARESLLREVLEKAEKHLRDVPVVIVGDLNTSGLRSPTLQFACDNNWTDAAKLQAEADSKQNGVVEPPPTFYRRDSEGTRIDYALLNPISANALVSCHTHDIGVPSHYAVSITLDLPSFSQNVAKYVLPRELPPGNPGSEAQQQTLCRQLLAKYDFPAGLAQGVNEAWTALSCACEEFLFSTNDPGRVGKSHLGRSLPRQPKSMVICSVSTPDSTGAASIMLRRLNNLLNKIRTLARILRSRTRNNDISGLLRNISQACQELNFAVSDTFSLKSLELLEEAVSAREKRLVRETRAAREKSFTEEINQNFGAERRSISAWCKGNSGMSVQAIKRSDGTLTASMGRGG